jgi:hypothetical protein
VVRLKLGGRTGEPPAWYEHPAHLGEQGLWMAHVLEHLLAVNEVESALGERYRDSVEGLEASVGSRPEPGFRRVWNVDAHPIDVRIARAKDVEGAADATPEVEHPPRLAVATTNLLFDVAVGERLASMIPRHGIAEQLLEVATRQPHRRWF